MNNKNGIKTLKIYCKLMTQLLSLYTRYQMMQNCEIFFA